MELIDREKLIAQYSANPETKGFIELVRDDCVVEALKKAEVIDAVPVVHAKWIVKFDDRGWKKHSCSNCGYFRRTDIHVSLNWDYCPHCGAKMDLEEK